VLSDSALEAVADRVGGLTRLQMLDVTDNRLAALPDAVAALRGLHVLYLGDNRLTELPPAVHPVPALAPVAAQLERRGCLVLWWPVSPRRRGRARRARPPAAARAA
jgi:hypothetical protein